MTYNVFSGTLNLTQSIMQAETAGLRKCCNHGSVHVMSKHAFGRQTHREGTEHCTLSLITIAHF